MKKSRRRSNVSSQLTLLIVFVVILSLAIALSVVLENLNIDPKKQLAQAETGTTGTTDTSGTSDTTQTTTTTTASPSPSETTSTSGTSGTSSGGGDTTTTTTTAPSTTDTSTQTTTTTPPPTDTSTSGTNTSGTSGSGGGTSITVPMPPSSLNAAPGVCGSGRLTLSWLDSSGATGYRLKRNGTVIYEGTALSYTDQGLTPNWKYEYGVSAFNSTGGSSFTFRTAISPPLCVTDPYPTSGFTTELNTSPIPTTNTTYPTASTTTYTTSGELTTTNTIPRAPTYLSLAPGPASVIALKWIDNSTNEDKWNIERKPSSATYYTFLKQISGANITSYIDSSVTLGVSYDYRVQACLSGTGCSDYTYLYGVRSYTTAYTATTTTIATTTTTIVPTLATTTTFSIPRAPSNLVFRSESTTSAVSGIYLRWNDNSNNEDKWNIERKPSGAPYYYFVKQLIGPNITTYFDTGITVGTSYDYRVQACLSGSGCSEYTYLYGVKVGTSTISTFTPYLSTFTPSTTATATTLVRPPVTAPVATSGPVIATSSLIIQRVAEAVEQVKTAETENVKIDEKVIALMPEKQIQDLFKDSNNDGISDFDSTHIYNIDPYKPSPVTYSEGKKITAGEKILLGYDPAKEELVKVVPEEPEKAVSAPVTTAYKVEEVALNVEEKVTLKGAGLPNSFVTLYIYSTPIIVTVKTNSEGEWEYTLDKELETGEHTVYAATVNNTGKILAKSNAYTFTKTAEAATLNSVTVGTTQEKPGLTPVHIYILVVLIVLMSIVILFIIGRNIKENNDQFQAPPSFDNTVK